MDKQVPRAVLAVAVAIAGCSEKKSASPEGPPARVITLTPSATELVVALGALDRLVGTDKFSDEPAAVAALPKVGDFLAPNVEVIAKLKPDLVICDAVQSKASDSLSAIGIDVLAIEMHSVSDVRKALASVSDRLGVPERGTEVVASIDRAIAAARERAKQRPDRPRVLWVMDRQPGPTLAELVVAGPGSFSAELLELVGARNAVTGSVRYPKLSREALLKVAPAVVIDASGTAAESMEAWTGGEWRAVPAATSLATPGPKLGGAVEVVESLIFP